MTELRANEQCRDGDAAGHDLAPGAVHHYAR